MSASILLAGGGTTGHISPMLAIGRRLREDHPDLEVFALGTPDGLETRIVPAAGFELLTIDKAPMPRRPNKQALRFPKAFADNISKVKEILTQREVRAVVGVGGYVCPPAFLAARSAQVPIIVHEANAKPGMANRLGAFLTKPGMVGVTFPQTRLRNAALVGMPMPQEIVGLDRSDITVRRQARADLGLEPDRATLVVTGGSSGAERINNAFVSDGWRFEDAGVQVLHITGAGKGGDLAEATAGLAHYHVVDYVDGMHRAYAAADLLVARSGAATVAETTVTGVPAVYIPLAIGNGEQRLNASGSVEAGASLMIENSAFTGESIAQTLVPLVTDPDRLAAMSTAALELHYPTDAATTMARIVTRSLRGSND